MQFPWKQEPLFAGDGRKQQDSGAVGGAAGGGH